MKKMVLSLLAAVFPLVILVGCAGGQSAPTGTTAEIADKVFAAAGVESFGMSQNLATEEDNEFYCGLPGLPGVLGGDSGDAHDQPRHKKSWSSSRPPTRGM